MRPNETCKCMYALEPNNARTSARKHVCMHTDACVAVQATLESMNARVRSAVAAASELPSDEADATKREDRRAPTEDVLEMLDHALESSRAEADALRARVSDLDLMLQSRDTELSSTRRTKSQMSEDLQRSQVHTCTQHSFVRICARTRHADACTHSCSTKRASMCSYTWLCRRRWRA